MVTGRHLSRRSAGTSNGRRSRSATRVVLNELDRTRRDAGVSMRRLATAADVSQAHLSQVFSGQREPSISFLTAISAALGGDLSVHFYPSGGPQIHDGVQARIVEALLAIADPTWDRHVEVPVHRPVRGFIDLVFDSRQFSIAVATEVESRLDRLEQEIRWAQDKADSLPSSDLWRFLPGERVISRLLVLRSTVATRGIARRFEALLRAAYPATAAAVHKALTTSGVPWPGPGILWADVRGDDVRILDRPPRGVALGR